MELKINKITEDERGAIFLVEDLLDNKKEFTFMEMKKGFARGGCLHSNKEFFTVIHGKVKFICEDEEKELLAGSSGTILPLKPHAFIALEDSIVSEWGITTAEKKEDKRDVKLREKVENINKSNKIKKDSV